MKTMPQGWRRLREALGPPGLVIGLAALFSSGFGLMIFARETGGISALSEDAVRRVLARYIREIPPSYQGYQPWAVEDIAKSWTRNPSEWQSRLDDAIDWLGERMAVESGFVLRLESLKVVDSNNRNEVTRWNVEPRQVEALAWKDSQPGATKAEWRSFESALPDQEIRTAMVRLADDPNRPLDLVAAYSPRQEIAQADDDLRGSYRTLLLALVCLSGFPLLCLLYMGLQSASAMDRVASDAARQATLDLADRTCHELGNIVFTLANERRNLSDHLERVDRFLNEQNEALETAVKRSGIEAGQAGRFRQALKREYADREIDPEFELSASAAVARDVCRQIQVCSEYVSMTVRELDGYLKQSSLPVQLEAVAVNSCFDDAEALMQPRLAATSARIQREGATDETVKADRRLLAHVLVNLLKNALEASSTAGVSPRLSLSAKREGETVWIEVADNGPGIAANDLRKIFQDGYSTKGAGRGRGLAIVRESVAAQGGRIEVSSQPGQGATFRIALPHASGLAS